MCLRCSIDTFSLNIRAQSRITCNLQVRSSKAIAILELGNFICLRLLASDFHWYTIPLVRKSSICSIFAQISKFWLIFMYITNILIIAQFPVQMFKISLSAVSCYSVHAVYWQRGRQSSRQYDCSTNRWSCIRTWIEAPPYGPPKLWVAFRA